MNKEWLETIRALAHKSMLGKLLAIAPPGGDESKSMRRRLDLLADFAQHVVEVADDEWSRSGADNRNVFTDGSHSEPPIPDRRIGPLDRRLNGHGLVWLGFPGVERSNSSGRRNGDRYLPQEPLPPVDRRT